MRQYIAGVLDAGRIDRYITFVDVTDNAFLINQESRTISEALLFIEDSVIPYECAFEIAEYGEGNAKLFGKLAIGGNTVYTEAENLCVVRFEFGDMVHIDPHLSCCGIYVEQGRIRACSGPDATPRSLQP